MTSHPTQRLADGILVINLDHRPERLETFAKTATKHPLLESWQRLPAVSGVNLSGFGQRPWFRNRRRDRGWAGRAGCTLSHRKAIEQAKANGWKSVLILEDDVLPGDSFSQDAAEWLNHPVHETESWDVCYLGTSVPLGPSIHDTTLPKERSIYRIFGCSGAFAYILRHTTYDFILSHLPDETSIWPWVFQHRAIDRWYARNLSSHFRVSAVFPNLIGHYTSFSDIGQRAGADIGITVDATPETHPFRCDHPIRFAIETLALRCQFRFAKAIQQLRTPIAKLTGFK